MKEEMRISDILTNETLTDDDEEDFTINMKKKKKKDRKIGGSNNQITACSSFRSVFSRLIPSLKRSKGSANSSWRRVETGELGVKEDESVLLESASNRDVCNEDDESASPNLTNDSEMENSSARYMKDDSFSLGLGAGFVFLMVACKNELNKMMELRSQVEVLIKDEIRREDVICQPSKSSDVFGFSTTSSPVVANTKYNPTIRNHVSSHDMLRKDMLVEQNQHSECSQTKQECVQGIDQLEVEFEAELERLQFSLDEDSLEHTEQQEQETVDENTALVRSDNLSDGVVEDPVEMEKTALVRSDSSSDEVVEDPVEMGKAALVRSNSSNDEVVDDWVEMDNGEQHGVSPYELERRLHELVAARQQERIKELECALESAKQKLHQKEIEINLWKKTASLVSQHVSDVSCLSMSR